MPTKYQRSTHREGAFEGRKYSRGVQWKRKGIPLKRRLQLIYLGIAFLLLVVLIIERISGSFTLANQPVLSARALIVEKGSRKSPGIETTWFLRLEVELDGDTIEAAVQTDLSSWELVEVGDPVDITYQRNRSRNRIVVYSLNVTPTQGTPKAHLF